MRINKAQAAEMLLSMDNILILAHENPDGDAVGSACALCKGLRQLGKKAKISLEPAAKIDAYLTEGLTSGDFEPLYKVAVDTADCKILGVGGTSFQKDVKIDLCIDHHISNVFYAENTYLDEKAAAAAEAVADILSEMKIKITKDIAECLYVGISTDTGCFRYGNTTPKTLRTAADMADTGIDIGKINKIQFETKSKEYAEIEKLAIASMETYLEGKCAVIVVTNEMYKQTGIADSETQPLASIPRQIDGVLVGITMKEKQPGFFRISIRTNEPADASEIAKFLGGGGHKMAAGCSYKGTKENAVGTVLQYTEMVLRETGLI